MAGEKIFLLSQQGKEVVIKPGAEWEQLAVNGLDEDTFATSAIFDNKLYIRTKSTLYSFAEKD